MKLELTEDEVGALRLAILAAITPPSKSRMTGINERLRVLRRLFTKKLPPPPIKRGPVTDR